MPSLPHSQTELLKHSSPHTTAPLTGLSDSSLPRTESGLGLFLRPHLLAPYPDLKALADILVLSGREDPGLVHLLFLLAWLLYLRTPRAGAGHSSSTASVPLHSRRGSQAHHPALPSSQNIPETENTVYFNYLSPRPQSKISFITALSLSFSAQALGGTY